MTDPNIKITEEELKELAELFAEKADENIEIIPDEEED
jgi:hypothetical protein